MAWKKEESKKDIIPQRARELALRETFKNVKSVASKGVIEKGNTTPTNSKVG